MRSVLITYLLLALAAPSAQACSTYALHTPGGTLFGRNTDGAYPVAGVVVVNKRGIDKFSLPWGFAGPAMKPLPRARWTSRYGSVTFSHFGREFPDGGVNEAGLIIEEMQLDGTVYPEAAGRPVLAVQQWLQYQLDNYATADDVVRHATAFNIHGWPWHFTIADKGGNCATLEFARGQAVIARGGLQDECVLTNDRFQDAAAQLQRVHFDAAAGPTPQDPSSMARFLRANALLRQPVPATVPERRDFAFKILGGVAQGKNTFRSVVYDLGAGKVYFRSPSNPGIKEVSFAKLDFSPASPALMLDIETPGEGDVTTKFKHYDPALNRRIVEGLYGLIHTNEGVSKALAAELAAARKSEGDFITAIADYPSTTHAASVRH